LLLACAGQSPAAENHWIRLKSSNFEVYSSAGPRSALDTLREFEQVRGFFLQSFGGPPAKPVPVRLVAFSSPKEFEAYKINEFATAYYHQTADRDYIVMSHAGAGTFSIAVHEYVHLLVRHAGFKFPPWLNEGLAELYSTLKPYGGKILVGDLIPGRHRALLEGKWVPLDIILAAGNDSPYYNEKDKAGSLYNEGWALTHMLCFRKEYRPKFGELLLTISHGKESRETLSAVYGKSVAEIERDLQSYLRGSSFQGFLFPAKLDKQLSDEIPAETLSDFDTGLMFADLMYRPGKENEQQAAFERLIAQDPKRPEPYRGLGYLAWRAGRSEDARQQFGMAFERGDRDPKLLWDYGRLLESRRRDEAIRVFSELLKQDGERVDVRLELADTQLRSGNAVAALTTLGGLHTIAAADSARFFRITVHAQLQNGDQKDAELGAQHFMDVAKTDADRAFAELLLREATASKAKPVVEAAEVTATGPPALRHAAAASPLEPGPALPAPQSASGRFVELDCRGKQARMIVETAAGKKVFLIEDPATVTITGQSDGHVDMTCGSQKTPPKVDVGYNQRRSDQTGVDGIVRSLAYR